MPRALIIGYGNPLRSDDGLGWQAAYRLAATLKKEAPVEVLAVHQLTPELGDSIRDAGLVLFIDASHQGQPGTWRCAPVEWEATPSPALVHHLTPASLLAYARALFGASPPALLISVGGESFGYGEKLTPRVEAALPGVIRHAARACLAEGTHGSGTPGRPSGVSNPSVLQLEALSVRQ